MKRCARCKENKKLDDFSVRRRAKDGRNEYCRSCQSTIAKESYTGNRIHRIEAGKRYYQVHANQINSRARDRRKSDAEWAEKNRARNRVYSRGLPPETKARYERNKRIAARRRKTLSPDYIYKDGKFEHKDAVRVCARCTAKFEVPWGCRDRTETCKNCRRERDNRRKKEHRAKNIENYRSRERENSKRYYKEYRSECLARLKEYRSTHMEQHRQYQRREYREKPIQVKERNRRWVQANLDKVRPMKAKLLRRRRQQLADWYIKQILRNTYGFQRIDITPKLINDTKECLVAHRLGKQIKSFLKEENL